MEIYGNEYKIKKELYEMDGNQFKMMGNDRKSMENQ